jgi:2-oxo-3-hexenedioate decarboxylase
MGTVDELAARLDRAQQAGKPTEQLTAGTELDVATAYQIQAELVGHRIRRGERLVGLKLGLTSRAKMAQVGVWEVIWGQLTDAMRIPDGGTVEVAGHVHPRVEPEVAFLLAGEPDPAERFEVAVRAVAPALELIDSRYRDFRFTLPDVIADNASAAGFVLGRWRPVPDRLDHLGVLLEVDGRVVETGSTAAILGDPRRAYHQGVRLAGRAGVRLPAEWVLLAGAATAAVPLTPGSYLQAVVEGLGTASLGAV